MVPRPPESQAGCATSSSKKKSTLSVADAGAEPGAAVASRIERPGPGPSAQNGTGEAALLQTASAVHTSTPHALGGLHAVLLDRGVDLRAEAAREVVRAVLRHLEDRADAVPLDRLLEVVAALLVVIEEDVDLVDPAEEVVDVAHDVLVRAREEHAEVVG